ncbi:glyoxalase [Mucilaginibacter sp. SP1R1]|uniref:glyoxalase n=1 Tax=Mucilaginibacter sp. SP1R1 TaxID=2723091 RepID=UPI00160E5A23|nr:glyoxalase [Mucilaginibacter sp. SP1R1]MBB6147954.1 catechol 2,3-dioxygenase-like lactoylglutathione lyase family enzyme [Mucilaginibacter sp. SP1R1]
MHIDHTTLRTRHVEQTKGFLIRIFDLTVGSRPAVIGAGIPGYWLYYKDAPLIHLIQSSSYHEQQQNDAAEAIDHTAFYMENYDAFKQKFIDHDVAHSIMNLPDIGERRIFLRTPTGILLETVFRS